MYRACNTMKFDEKRNFELINDCLAPEKELGREDRRALGRFLNALIFINARQSASQYGEE